MKSSIHPFCQQCPFRQFSNESSRTRIHSQYLALSAYSTNEINSILLTQILELLSHHPPPTRHPHPLVAHSLQNDHIHPSLHPKNRIVNTSYHNIQSLTRAIGTSPLLIPRQESKDMEARNRTGLARKGKKKKRNGREKVKVSF